MCPQSGLDLVVWAFYPDDDSSAVPARRPHPLPQRTPMCRHGERGGKGQTCPDPRALSPPQRPREMQAASALGRGRLEAGLCPRTMRPPRGAGSAEAQKCPRTRRYENGVPWGPCF